MEFKKKLAENLAAKQADNKTSMILHAGFVGLGIAVGVATSGLVSTVAIIIGAINGFDLLRDAGRARGLEQAKTESSSSDTLPETAARAQKHGKAASRAHNVSLAAVGVFLAAVAVAIVAPATLAVTGPIMQAALGAGIVTLGISNWREGQSRAAASSLQAVKDVSAAPEAAAAPEAPAAKQKWSTRLLSVFKRNAAKVATAEAPKPAAPAPAAPSAPTP